MRHRPRLMALRTFDAAGRLDSITAAASELSVAPGTVSHRIGNLQDDVGVALLKCSGAGCGLAEDGTRPAHGLAGAISTIAEAVDNLRRPAHRKVLRVRVAPMPAHAWLIQRLDRFSRLSPDFEIVTVGQNGRLDGMADAEPAIERGRFRDDEKHAVDRLSGPEEIVPVCRPQVCRPQVCRGGSLAGSALFGLECAGSRPGPARLALLPEGCRPHNLSRRSGTAPDRRTALECCTRGRGGGAHQHPDRPRRPRLAPTRAAQAREHGERERILAVNLQEPAQSPARGGVPRLAAGGVRRLLRRGDRSTGALESGRFRQPGRDGHAFGYPAVRAAS